MAINISKNSSIVIVANGSSMSFFNNYITNDMSKTYYYFSPEAKDISKPDFTVDFSKFTNKRCLQYRMFKFDSALVHNNSVVLMKNGKSYLPLFEAINITATFQSEIPALSITFWSNLLEGMTTALELASSTSFTLADGIIKKKDDKFYQYKYDPNKIQTFSQKEYDDLTFGTTYKIIFCSSQVSFELRKVLTQDQIDSNVTLDSIEPETVLVLKKLPIVIDEIEDNYPILDFAGMGGDGGGMRQHSHIPTIDGTNFAFAVFHPGTSMPQLPWDT